MYGTLFQQVSKMPTFETEIWWNFSQRIFDLMIELQHNHCCNHSVFALQGLFVWF